jgi:hypothetical protein
MKYLIQTCAVTCVHFTNCNLVMTGLVETVPQHDNLYIGDSDVLKWQKKILRNQ